MYFYKIIHRYQLNQSLEKNILFAIIAISTCSKTDYTLKTIYI